MTNHGEESKMTNPGHEVESVKIGTHWTPDEFIKEAIKVGHPVNLTSCFPEQMLECVRYGLSRSHHDIARERTAELRRMTLLAEGYAQAEKELKNNMSKRRREVLKQKRLLLFKQLLIDSNHSDATLVDDMREGFDLTGMLPRSHVFKDKFRPASITSKELRDMAPKSRMAMISSTESSGDSHLDQALFESTLKEVDKGFLVGPIAPEELPVDATVTRRFGVVQKSKVRPIQSQHGKFVGQPS